MLYFKGTRFTYYFNINEMLTDVSERSLPAYK